MSSRKCKTRVLLSDSTDPVWNLAVEEYLMTHTEPNEIVLYLWQNDHTVVLGRNQDLSAEVREKEFRNEGGTIVRRLSGGGAVYHDLGNLNYTFIAQRGNYDVGRQLGVILAAVGKAGIEAEKTGRNDVTAGGLKFSGNAFYQSGKDCCHHGTLLVSTDLDKMNRYLSPSAEKLKARGVESVRSRVVNLTELSPNLTVE
ncbi:MAG: lipoate--protein ligase, partial [Lachnospiraceae bacterium]|nr:lipoate--protein ligase [Lachnospiraceae bacterium]